MPLQLELIDSDPVPIEVQGILPSTVRGRSLAEIAQLPIYHGNRPLALGDRFRLAGEADDEIVWVGDLSGVHWIGARMDAGRILVEGNAGRHVGSEMTGGQIIVSGNCGDWVGAELHGGTIDIRGNAGHLVGAAYRGSPRGMTGGTIRVHGDAGNETGHSMRRGLVAIGGATGDLIGINMQAGTVVAGGPTGIRHGAGMKRGTLIFLDATPPTMLPSFRLAGPCQPLFFQLLGRSLQRAGFPGSDLMLDAEFYQYHGDLIEGGRGEIFTASPAP
ncbi:MAG: formylmethanofuran dehydrogenase subunit C [Pirellulales bacterium]